MSPEISERAFEEAIESAGCCNTVRTPARVTQRPSARRRRPTVEATPEGDFFVRSGPGPVKAFGLQDLGGMMPHSDPPSR